MCELLVGLPEVNVLAIEDRPGGPLGVHVETRGGRPGCPACGGGVLAKDRATVEPVDLPCFDRPVRLVWRKRRWACPSSSRPAGSFTEAAPAIGAPRLVMTDRAGRWVTEQVGRWGRTVNEVAVELGCDEARRQRLESERWVLEKCVKLLAEFVQELVMGAGNEDGASPVAISGNDCFREDCCGTAQQR